jgi:hypothetical protein
MGSPDFMDDFNSPFWADDFALKLSDVPGPLAVAGMTQTNAYERHDAQRFHENAKAIADDFVALMKSIK